MTDVVLPRAPARPVGWLQSPTHDVVMAFIWVPFALAAHAVAHEPEHLRWLVSATLLFSFAHQPLTLWLAYGDAGQRRANLRLFALAPPIVIVAVALGTSVQPAMVALVAGVWNVGHTIRQRYGVSRLYGRLNGIDCASDNRLLWSWLSLAVVFAISMTNLGDTARDVGLGRRSTSAIDVLASVRGVTFVLLPLAVAVAVVLTARAAGDEWRRPTHSTARLVYLGSTAMLLVVLAIEPVTGFVAYVGAHAAEYLLVVRWRIGRAAERATPRDRVGAVARRIGSGGTLALYAAAMVALVVCIRAADGSTIALTVVLTLGALHLLYDGFLWHSPRPASRDAPAATREVNR